MFDKIEVVKGLYWERVSYLSVFGRGCEILLFWTWVYKILLFLFVKVENYCHSVKYIDADNVAGESIGPTKRRKNGSSGGRVANTAVGGIINILYVWPDIYIVVV